MPKRVLVLTCAAPKMLVLMDPVLTVSVFRSAVFTENAVKRLSVMLAVLTLFVFSELIVPTWTLMVFTFMVDGFKT